MKYFRPYLLDGEPGIVVLLRETRKGHILYWYYNSARITPDKFRFAISEHSKEGIEKFIESKRMTLL